MLVFDGLLRWDVTITLSVLCIVAIVCMYYFFGRGGSFIGGFAVGGYNGTYISCTSKYVFIFIYFYFF